MKSGGEDIENKQIETKYASNDDYEYIDESEDGYMKIITRCDYLPCYRGDEKGWYMFSLYIYMAKTTDL